MKTKKGKSQNLPENVALDSNQSNEFSGKVKKLSKKAASKNKGPGVIFLKHIPKGFFEPQIKSYFGQFGDVKRIHLSRSKKSGHSKGYAFIEFENEEVAKIAASAMNNYLMFQRLLKCEFVPADQVHPETFRTAHRRFTPSRSRVIAAERHNAEQSETQMKRAQQRSEKRLQTLQAKLDALGVDFDLSEVPVEGLSTSKAKDVKPKAKKAQNEGSAKKKGGAKQKAVITPTKEEPENDDEMDSSDDDLDFDAIFGTGKSETKKKEKKTPKRLQRTKPLTPRSLKTKKKNK